MSKGQARIFVPLTKVDEEQRLVYGRISHEVLDKSGETMDYATSKPLFEKWSQDVEAASGGLSKGNVRVMHGLVAAGKLTELEFHDEDQAIDVCAKIVDEAEWNKVTEGVYTGFSVGGKYAKKWSEKQADGSTIKKYTAQPMEVSIVDNPCVPSATFSMFKADGAVEEVAFQVEHDANEWPLVETLEKSAPAEPRTAAESAVIGDPSLGGPQPTNEQVASKATELAKAAGKDEKDWADFIEPARVELTKGNPGDPNSANEKAGGHNPLDEDQTAKKPAAPKTKVKPSTTTLVGKGPGDTPGTTGADNPANKVTSPGISQKWLASDGTAFEKKAEAEAHEATLLAKGDQRDTGDENPEGKPAVEGEVIPDGEQEKGTEEEGKELPLADQLKAALATVGETLAKAEVARTEDDEDAPLPLFADFDRLSKAVAFIEEDADEVLQKSIYTVSRFADVLSSMAGLMRSVKNHSEADSALPDEIKQAVTDLSGTFQTFANEQVTKLIANLDDPKSCDYYYCAAKEEGADSLAKDVAELIETVQEPADLVKSAIAAAITPAPVDEDDTGEGDSLQKVTAERDDLAKAVKEVLPQLQTMAKRIETLENTPLPRAPRNIVEKDGGNGLLKGTTDTERLAEVAELVQTMGPDALATMMIKASQSTGGQRLNPVG